jgi:DNA invertase Pin-like site-specific DNA recombinase
MKAFAYLRVSGKGQLDGDGFPRQLAAVQQYASTNGITINRVFREKGVSGTVDGIDRPAWMEMIAAAREADVNVIVIEKLDRLARDLMIQERILADLKIRGLTLVSVAEPDLCSTDPTRTLLRQIVGAVAQYDKASIVSKLRAARQRQRARDGKCEGAKAYGAWPGESAGLERIRAMHMAGTAFQAIAHALNAEGIAPRRGLRWHPHAVARIARRGGVNSLSVILKMNGNVTQNP